MLCLEDPGLPVFAMHNLDEYQSEIDDAGDYATRVAEGKRLFGSRNRPSNATFRAVREGLSQMCAGTRRCVYCEDSVADEVEHMKPKDLYPEDVFRWPNYVYACGPCNRHKNNNFAIIAEDRVEDVTRARGAPITPPTLGEPAIINPRSEDPLDLMTIDLLGTFFVLPREGLDTIQADRAHFTIETLGLNRDLLLSARKNAFGGYRARLLEYRDKRDAGATVAELGRLRSDLLATPHPSVWEEMKRQAGDIPVIDTIFEAVRKPGLGEHTVCKNAVSAIGICPQHGFFVVLCRTRWQFNVSVRSDRPGEIKRQIPDSLPARCSRAAARRCG